MCVIDVCNRSTDVCTTGAPSHRKQVFIRLVTGLEEMAERMGTRTRMIDHSLSANGFKVSVVLGNAPAGLSRSLALDKNTCLDSRCATHTRCFNICPSEAIRTEWLRICSGDMLFCKGIALISVLLCMPIYGVAEDEGLYKGPYHDENTGDRNQRMAWWREARFGLFITRCRRATSK